MVAIDSSKQKALDADPKVIQKVNFTINLNNAVIFFSIEKEKETVFFFF